MSKEKSYSEQMQECLDKHVKKHDDILDCNNLEVDARDKNHLLHNVKGLLWDDESEAARRHRVNVLRTHTHGYVCRADVTETVPDSGTVGFVPNFARIESDDDESPNVGLTAIRTVDHLDSIRLQMKGVITGWLNNRTGALSPDEISDFHRCLKKLERPLDMAMAKHHKKAA